MKKKLILLLLTAILLLFGCGSSTSSAQKISDTLLNHFPSDEQLLLKEANPDLVTMEYLVEHSSDYSTNLSSDRNDFFVVVHGTVTSIETEEYDEDILDKMDPDIASSLRGKTNVDIFLDDCLTALSDPINAYNVEKDKEYYFFVYVKENSSNYSYTPFSCYTFD